MNPLFGRTNELRLLVEALERAEQGQGSLVVLSGEAGIGKSRLLRELEAYAGGRSVSVLWGRAWEAGGAPAFWPWTQVFRGLGGNPFGAREHGAEASQRFALFDEATRVLAEAAREKPCLVLLDDLHVADVPSLLLLLFVAREIRGLRVLLVGAARETYPRPDPEAGALLAKIRREATVLPLLRLTEQEVGVWAAARSAAHPEQIYLASEGNPLARSLGDERGVEQARQELDALAEQLAGAVGLGGRDRRAASNVERARINVQRRIKDTLESVFAADAGLGRYLQASIKTGTFCSFMPV